MAYELPSSIQELIAIKMATGMYASTDQLLLKALHALDDYEQTVADIRDGLEDERLGRVRTLAEADQHIRQELGFSQ